MHAKENFGLRVTGEHLLTHITPYVKVSLYLNQISLPLRPKYSGRG